MQTLTEPTGPTRAKKFPKLCSETCGGRFATKTLDVCMPLVKTNMSMKILDYLRVTSVFTSALSFIS
jgi:hypothetical protein